MQSDFVQQAIAKIYDCAVEPELWRDTLEALRIEMDTAFCSLQFVHFPDTYPDDPPFTELYHTDWDVEWFVRLQPTSRRSRISTSCWDSRSTRR